MIIVETNYKILRCDWEKELEMIEVAARNCYQSEVNSDTRFKFIKGIINNKHMAMVEFGDMTVQFIVGRDISHQIVRHRLFSFAQESTRYNKYDDGTLRVVRPTQWIDISNELKNIWVEACRHAEVEYNALLKAGATLDYARKVLPHSTATSLIVKGNFREWLHFFSLRTNKRASPDMQYIANQLLKKCKAECPTVFGE